MAKDSNARTLEDHEADCTRRYNTIQKCLNKNDNDHTKINRRISLVLLLLGAILSLGIVNLGSFGRVIEVITRIL